MTGLQHVGGLTGDLCFSICSIASSRSSATPGPLTAFVTTELSSITTELSSIVFKPSLRS